MTSEIMFARTFLNAQSNITPKVPESFIAPPEKVDWSSIGVSRKSRFLRDFLPTYCDMLQYYVSLKS